MRQAGVRERIEHLRAAQKRRDDEHPESTLRRELTAFVHKCALLAFDDLPTGSVVETYRAVLGHLDDPTQMRTGSALERAGLDAVDRLRTPIAKVADTAERHAARDEEVAQGPLLQIPAVTLMGRYTRDAYFPMACWNAAGSLHDGAITAYRAASMIAYVGYYDPPEEPELLAAMRAAQERYEDEPERRPVTAREIAGALDDWLDRRLGT